MHQNATMFRQKLKKKELLTEGTLGPTPSTLVSVIRRVTEWIIPFGNLSADSLILNESKIHIKISTDFHQKLYVGSNDYDHI